MNIVSASLYRQIQPFAEGAYTCRGMTESGFDAAIVSLTAEDGTTGWGEAAPLGAFYAEAFPEAMRAGIIRLLPEVRGLSATAPARLADHLDDIMFGQPAVKSAIDMAAWDLAARIAGLPLAALLGGACGTSIVLYRSISQDSPDVMAEKAARFVQRGYRRLQVKTGADPLEDVERLKAVRAAIPGDVPLYADANGGWLIDDALRFVDATRGMDYSLEQPCMAYADNRAIARHCHRPLILDEGICGLSDLLTAHADGTMAGVTLKLARLGGITPTVLLRDVAVRLGLKVTIEDTGGSTIDTAATAHLMCSMPPRARAHTVDFNNWVTARNATGMPPVSDGCLHLPAGPGIGVTADLSALGEPLFSTGK